MSSSTRDSTIDGYVTEYCNAYHVSPLQAIQTAMVRLVIQEIKNRDMAINDKQEKGDEKCLYLGL